MMSILWINNYRMLKNKNIIITGCLSGIGHATMENFSKNGANLWACFQKESPDVYKSIDNLTSKYNIWIEPLFFDFLDPDKIKEAVLKIRHKKQIINGLVNIAGITKDSIFHMIKMDDIKETFEINFNSQILFTQYISKLMLRQNYGSIIFTSSITAFDGNIGQLSYGASKSALISAVKTLSIELSPKGIRVNAVAPGVIDTEMTRKAKEEQINNIINKTSLKRIGLPEEVANIYMFLCSELSSYITGQIIRIDGGLN